MQSVVAEHQGRLCSLKDKPPSRSRTLSVQPIKKAAHLGLAGLWYEYSIVAQGYSVGPALGVYYLQLILGCWQPSIIGHKIVFYKDGSDPIPNLTLIYTPS